MTLLTCFIFQGEYYDPYIPPTPRDGKSDNSPMTPVIKHRTGSNIKTPSRNFASHTNDTDTVKLKLNFDERKLYHEVYCFDNKITFWLWQQLKVKRSYITKKLCLVITKIKRYKLIN